MKNLTEKQIDEKIKEKIKDLIDNSPEHTKKMILNDGTVMNALIVCVGCLSYISQAWVFCPHCGKKSKKLSDVQRRKALYKTLKKSTR